MTNGLPESRDEGRKKLYDLEERTALFGEAVIDYAKRHYYSVPTLLFLGMFRLSRVQGHAGRKDVRHVRQVRQVRQPRPRRKQMKHRVDPVDPRWVPRKSGGNSLFNEYTCWYICK